MAGSDNRACPLAHGRAPQPSPDVEAGQEAVSVSRAAATVGVHDGDLMVGFPGESAHPLPPLKHPADLPEPLCVSAVLVLKCIDPPGEFPSFSAHPMVCDTAPNRIEVKVGTQGKDAQDVHMIKDVHIQT